MSRSDRASASPTRRLICAVAFVLAIPAIAACRQQTSSGRVEGWRGDIDTLVAEARRLHAGPARPAHSTEFARAAADLARRVPELADHRVVVELQRLLAMLGDGHSLVYPAPSRVESFAALPIDVYLFDDGLFVVNGIGAAGDLVGSRIDRVGPLATAEVLRRLEPYMSRDNAMGPKAFASLYCLLPIFLEAVGATESLEQVTLAITDRAGQKRDVVLLATSPRRTQRRLYAPPTAPTPIPLYLRQSDSPYWSVPIPEHEAVYVQFNQVTDAPGVPLRSFASTLSAASNGSSVRNLIIDVRHNNGGNNELLAPLVDAVADFAGRDSARRVYVLTSRVTFSAAQNFINRLEQRVPSAIFAGEPSMSRPNFTGEDHPVELPYSGLTISISTRYWQDSRPDDDRPWIAPQIAVVMRAADWLANRDPVLDAVLGSLKGGAHPSAR